MKMVNGRVYLTIGEIAKKVDRTAITIKNWYEWLSEQPDEIRNKNQLPEPVILDLKGTRYYPEDTLPLFIAFRNQITYGKMSDTN
jgi:hypothetical protein